MNRSTFIAATAVLAAVAFSCPAHADIVVGVAIPSSGPKVELGRAIVETVAAEIAQINAAGGLNGEAISLDTADDDCSSDGGARVAANLIGRKVALVLGHPCSNAAMAAAALYARQDILFVAVGARHPDLTAKRSGPSIFRLGGRDDRQVTDTLAALAADFQGKRVVIVQDRTAYARALASGIATGFRKAGAANIVELPFVAGERQYDALVGQIKSANPDAIYFAGFPAEAEIILPAIRASNVNALFIGCDALEQMTPIAHMVIAQPNMAAPEFMRRLARTLQAWVAATRRADPATPTRQAFTTLVDADPSGDLPGPSYTIEMAKTVQMPPKPGPALRR